MNMPNVHIDATVTMHKINVAKNPYNFKQFIKFLMHSLVSKFQKKEKKGQSPVIKSACFIVCVLKALCSNDLFWL